MAGTEVFVIVAVIVFAAIFVPILLDENPAAFLENGLCSIFPPSGPPFICNTIKSNVTFVGLNGIDIFTNPTISNSTIFWDFTGNATGGNGTSKIHVSIGDGDVFKEETATEVRFRGITNGTGIDMIITGTDIELAVKRCDETGLVFFNATTDLYECISSNEFVSDVIFDNNEFFPPHLSVGGGADSIVTFSNYSARAIKMRANFNEDSSWLFIIPSNLNVTTVTFDILWFTDVASGTGDVCFELSTNLLQPNPDVVPGADLDGAFNQRVEKCVTATSFLADELIKTRISLSPVESQITAGDVAVMKLERRSGGGGGGNINDTFDRDTFILGGELKWAGD